MPKIDTIITNRKKEFKKRDYRPWNPAGDHLNENPDLINDSFTTSNEIVLLVDPTLIKNWEHHDRPENELGDIDSLANEFKTIGQQQPCIARLSSNELPFKYELIVGERRWRAAILAGTELKVIIKDLTDSDAAIVQASENLNRKDLSDFARGMSYYNLIKKNIIEQKDLVDRLNLSKQQVSRLLSFSKIPQEIITAINDMSNISSRTAEHLKQLSNKGPQYIAAMISLADRIREGKIGHEKLTDLVEELVKEGLSINRDKISKNYKYYFPNSLKRIFTMSPSKNNKGLSIHFSKETAKLFEENRITYEELALKLKEFIDDTAQK